MANGWTPERRARQALLIGAWKPWELSTGPKTDAGKMKSARNAYRGGAREELRNLARALAEQRNSIRGLKSP